MNEFLDLLKNMSSNEDISFAFAIYDNFSEEEKNKIFPIMREKINEKGVFEALVLIHKHTVQTNVRSRSF